MTYYIHITLHSNLTLLLKSVIKSAMVTGNQSINIINHAYSWSFCGLDMNCLEWMMLPGESENFFNPELAF